MRTLKSAFNRYISGSLTSYFCINISLRWITVIGARELPSHLYGYGLSGLLPVEDAAGCKLRFQGVLLDGGSYWAALTVYDHIGVCTFAETCKRHTPQQTIVLDHRLITAISRFGADSDLLSCPGSAAPRLHGHRRDSQLVGIRGMNSSILLVVYPPSTPCESTWEFKGLGEKNGLPLSWYSVLHLVISKMEDIMFH